MDEQTAPASEASAALAAAAAYGPYFTAYSVGESDDWVPLLRACSAGIVTAAVSRTAAALALEGADRVAASTWHLGVAAGLTSPLLGSALHGGVPDVGPDRVWIRTAGGGPLQVAMRPGRLLPPRGVALADVVEGLLSPLCRAVGEMYAVSARVLWGNAAASLTGAARVIEAVRPADGPAAREIVAGALQHGRLRGTVDADGFRRSCCLFYRAPGGGYCGDCVLATRARGVSKQHPAG